MVLAAPRRWGGEGSVIGRVQQNQSRSGQRRSRGSVGGANHQWLHVGGESHVGSTAGGNLRRGAPRVCSSFAVAGTAKPAPGGFIVDGTWPYNSGCRQSSWGQYLVNLHREDGTITPGNFVYIPMTEVEIKDTWYTVGMQGTSSDSVVGKNIFVPEHRFVSSQKTFGYREPGKKHVGAPSDNWQVFPLIRAAGLGQLVGAVEAALELALEGAQRKPVPNTTYTKQMNSPVVQRNLGEAAAKIDTAALLVDSLCGVQDQAALSGPTIHTTRARPAKGRLCNHHRSSEYRARQDHVRRRILRIRLRERTAAILAGFQYGCAPCDLSSGFRVRGLWGHPPRHQSNGRASQPGVGNDLRSAAG